MHKVCRLVLLLTQKPMNKNTKRKKLAAPRGCQCRISRKPRSPRRLPKSPSRWEGIARERSVCALRVDAVGCVVRDFTLCVRIPASLGDGHAANFAHARRSNVPQSFTSMNVFIYTRVSSGQQLDGSGLDRQKEYCKAFAAKNGWSVARVLRKTFLAPSIRLTARCCLKR